jgi:hypothetical protein
MSGARTYLTWSSWREKPAKSVKIDVLRVPHPWTLYRRKNNIIPKPDATGTMVFISHTLPSTSRHHFDFDKYVETLISLPSEFQPISLCLQMHDIKKGLHLDLEKYGLPIFSAGNSSSSLFVDRFYDLVGRHKFCTSNVIGSQLFYSEELGVPYFLLGAETVSLEEDGRQVSYYHLWDKDLVLKTKNLFNFENLGRSERKVDFLNQTLGIDIDSESLRKIVRNKLASDFFYLMPSLFVKVLRSAFSAVGIILEVRQKSQVGESKSIRSNT